MKPSVILPLFAAVLAPVLSSVAWLFEKEAVNFLHPVTVASCGTLLASIILWLYLLAARRIVPISGLRRHWRDIALRVFCAMIVGGLCMVYALSYTSSSKVIFLTKIEPYLIIMWDWLFRGLRISRYHKALLAVHILGAIILSTGGQLNFSADQWGDLLLLFGVAAHSLTYAPSKRLAEAFGAVEASAITQFLGGIILLPLALCLKPSDFMAASEVLPGWGYLCGTMLLYYVFSTVLWFYALKGFAAWILSALRCLGPIIAAPIAWIAFDQPLSMVQIVGALIVLVTSVLMVKSREDAHPAAAVRQEITGAKKPA